MTKTVITVYDTTLEEQSARALTMNAVAFEPATACADEISIWPFA